jgi:hypothetical protein
MGYAVNEKRREDFESGGYIDFVPGDVYKLDSDFCKGARLAFAFPPCTDLASSGARWWKSKEEKNPGTLRRAVKLAKRCWNLIKKADAYVLENPVGRLSTNWRKPDESFNPHEYGGYIDGGDAYTKRTCLWTGGEWESAPTKPVAPVLGSLMHKMPGGGTNKSRNARSVTPRGWSLATFQHMSAAG